MIIGDAASAKAALAEVGAESETMGGKLLGVGKLAAGGLAVGLGVAAGASIDLATKFQSSTELIHTQAGVSQKALDGLRKGILALAGPTATAPDELSLGLFHLASQGLRGKDALNALQIAAEGARVGQANLEDVTNALGAVLVGRLVKGVNGTKDAMGQLNAIVGAGDMHMQDLADAMGTGLAAAAHTAGVSLTQIGGALATFGDNNIRGAKAGTLLISTMRVLGHQSDAGIAALKDIGVNADTLQQKLSTEGLTGAIGYLKDQIASTHKPLYQVSSDLSEAFGGKQATGIKILLDEFDRLKTKVGDVSAGGQKFGKDWQATTQTTSFKLDQLKSSLEALGIRLGNVLLPAFTKIVSGLDSIVTWLESPKVDNAIKTFASGVMSALQPIIDWVKQNWPQIEQTITTVMDDTWAVVQGIIGAFKAGWSEFGGYIKTVFINDVHVIVQTIKNVVEVFRGVVDLIKGIAHGNWAEVWKGVKEIVAGVFGEIWALISGAGRNFAALMVQVGKMMWQGLQAGLEGIFHMQDMLITGILHAIEGVLSWVVGEAEKIGKAIITGVEKGIGGLAHAVGGGLKGAITGGLHEVTGFFGIHSPSRVFADELGQPLAEGVLMGFGKGIGPFAAMMKEFLAVAGGVSGGVGAGGLSGGAVALAAAERSGFAAVGGYASQSHHHHVHVQLVGDAAQFIRVVDRHRRNNSQRVGGRR